MIRATDLTDVKYVPSLLLWISFHPSECIYISAKGRGFAEPDGMAIFQIIFLDQVFVLDPYKHGSGLFAIPSEFDPSYTLRTVLQDPHRLKVGFDVRSLSHYLCHTFGVTMRNVLDLQVHDALRYNTVTGPYLSSLNKAVSNSHASYTPKCIKQRVSERAKKAKKYVDQKGGSSAPLYSRPLCKKVVFYCALDAILLPYLMTDFLSAPLEVREEALQNSSARLLDALKSDFILNAPERKLKDGDSQSSLKRGPLRSSCQGG